MSHLYQVSFNTLLGRTLSQHFAKCQEADRATITFLETLDKVFDFPIPITADTIYEQPDDCDAGGLFGINVSQADFDPSQLSFESRILWQWVQLNDDSLLFFPRIESHTHYLRMRTALTLHKNGAPDWDFDEMPDSATCPLRIYQLGAVRHLVNSRDLAQIKSGKNKQLPSTTRLARGRKYELADTTFSPIGNLFAPDSYKSDTHIFARAMCLYKAWNALPVVPANALTRILQLTLPKMQFSTLPLDERKEQFHKSMFLHWRIDKQHQRYLFYTGMTSVLTGVQETDDPEAVAMFNDVRHSEAENQ